MYILGRFEIQSGKVIVSDPCYDRGTWCAGEVDNVKNGTYIAFIRYMEDGQWGRRVSELVALFQGAPVPLGMVKTNPNKIPGLWELTDIHVGVDSGSAGIFDEPMYQKPLTEPYLQVGQRESEIERSRNRIKRARETGLDDVGQPLRELKFCKTPEELANFRAKQSEDMERHYAKIQPEPTMEWYDMCGDKSLSPTQAGVIPGGAVSLSGYGDGGYNAYVTKDESGQVVGIKIVFIGVDANADEDENDSQD